ncbi:hypothetical protein STENM223S_10336 [Streptomyces tendae]
MPAAALKPKPLPVQSTAKRPVLLELPCAPVEKRPLPPGRPRERDITLGRVEGRRRIGGKRRITPGRSQKRTSMNSTSSSAMNFLASSAFWNIQLLRPRLSRRGGRSFVRPVRGTRCTRP